MDGRGVPPAGRDAEMLRRYREHCTRDVGTLEGGRRPIERRSVTKTLETRALGHAFTALGASDRVLDVPVGAGPFLALLREKARQVVGADVSAGMLCLARSREQAAVRGGAPEASALVQADVLALPFADESFDAVVSIRLLHHIPSGRSRVDLLRELARVSSRYVVVTFFDYASVWALRQAWRRLRGKVVPWAVPLARFQAEAARAGLRFLRSIHVLPGVSEEQLLLFEKDPTVASVVEETPQLVSRRLRAGHWLTATAWLWAVLLGAGIFLCGRWEIEKAEFILWPLATMLMIAGAALRVWVHQFGGAARRTPGGGPYVLSRHPGLLGTTLWLSGFALACELWWMGVAVWLIVPGVLWPAIEYTEARQWLRHGHTYDLYAQRTPLLLPALGALRSLWGHALVATIRAPGTRPVEAGRWSTMLALRVAFVCAAGIALAVLKELSIS